jgi:hypothetical protein
VHLRRALLLFAIVLGLAALVASLSRSGEDTTPEPAAPSTPPSSDTGTAPTLSPGQSTTAELPATVRFVADRDQTRRLEFGRPATLEVAVDDPGQVEIPLLGVSTTADPITPARFEVFPREARRYPIMFTPAAGDETRPAGALLVIAQEP